MIANVIFINHYCLADNCLLNVMQVFYTAIKLLLGINDVC